MNNTDMETFWAVLEHGTLTAAAEALFITQPTLTNRIQSLEAEVGAQLFHRGKGIRHIELTEAGQRFLPLAYRWQTLLDETKGVAETATREYLRIGAVFSTNQYILPAAYRRFLRRKLSVALWVQTLRGAGYDGAQTVARRELEMALMDGDSMQVVNSFLGSEMMWAIVPAAAARALEKEGRAKICRLTDPPPERVSYLITRRGEALSDAAQLLLEDIRTEMRHIPGIQLFI